MADKSKDTGTGGINIDGKVHSMDVGLSNQENQDLSAINGGNWSSGDISVDKTVKDISAPTRETFAKYLSKTTLGSAGSSTHANKYPIGAGAGTTVEVISTKDANGFPVKPGPLSDPDAIYSLPVNQSVGEPPTLNFFKRGLSATPGQDGNNVLPGAAEPANSGGQYVKPALQLNEPIKTYTREKLDTNLYNPLKQQPLPDVVIGDGGNVQPENIRPLRVTDNMATDGGTSENVFNDADISVEKTVAEAAQQVVSETANNAYPVTANPNNNLILSQLNAANVLASSNNPKFSNALIGSPPVVSKGKLTNADALNKSLPGGNTLLPTAAVPANSGGEYIKNSQGLNEPIRTYSKNALDPNLYSPLDTNPTPNVTLGDGGNEYPANIRNINVVTNFPLDAGTSKNILQPTPDNSITLAEQAKKASAVTGGESTPSGLANQYPVDEPADPFRTYSVTQNGFPAGSSQPNTKNFGNNLPYQSTYTDSFKEANSATTNPFEIKRGKAPGAAPNGNELLTGVTELAPPGGDYVKKAGPMNSAMQTYISKVVDQNLKAPDPTVVVGPALIQLGEEGLPPTDEGAWPLHITTTLAEDGGTSKNVLTTTNPSHLLTLEEASAKAGEETSSAPVTEVANVYPVDTTLQKFSHTDPATQMPVGPEPVSNSQYFTKNAPINDSVLETYTESAQDLDIKRGKAVGDGPDGNKLLISAHRKSNPKSQEKTLQEPLKSYTDKVLGENLYVAENKSVQSFESPAQPFYGQPSLHVPGELNEYSVKTTAQDLGTFEKIIDDPSKRILNKEKATLRSLSELYGRNNVPGNVANKYTPSGILEPVEDFRTIDSTTGLPASPREAQGSNDNSLQFIEGNKIPTSYSEIAAESKLNEKIKRGKSSVDGLDGNELLPEAALPADPGGKYVKRSGGDGGPKDGPIKDYVSAVLKKNRFSNDKKFLPNPFGLDLVPDLMIDQKISDAGNETFMQNNAFPAPDALRLGESPGNDDETPRNYNFRRLTRIGTILQLRATGEIQALADDTTDPRDNTTILASLLPGVGQFGAGVPLSNEFLNVKNILRTLPEDGTNFPPDIPIYEGQLIDFNSTYEGVLNNVFDKFSGFTVIGMLATAALMVTVVVLAFTGLGLLFGLNSGAKIDGAGGAKRAGPSDNPTVQTGRHGIGSFHGAAIGSSPDDILNAFLPAGGDSSVLLRFFGIMPTRIEFGKAVNNGVLAFFGVDEDFNPLTTAQSPGFFVVMARSIVRSAVAIVLAFKDLVDLFATGNVVSAIEQIFEILYIIKKSRFVASLNIFGQLGDTFSVNADIDGLSNENQTIAGLDAGFKISETDGLSDDYPMAAYRKSRLGGKGDTTLKLAWASNRTPDVLVINNNSLALSIDTSLGSGRLLTDDPLQKTRFEYLDSSTVSQGARIPTLQREAYEKEFDSEYVPFYFHDLRTNELLGFHAFLMNLTDDYSAAYDSTEGFGRVDPIKVYKSTNRKISLGFVIAALDDKDFDSMWLKINKLTTLLYPQYTEGRRLTLDDGKNSFIKPFTQQIGASPMIRLRVGNVVTSNYSKFNLAGVFGFTSNGTTVNGQKSEDLLKNVKEGVEKAKKLKPSEIYRAGYQYTLKDGKYSFAKDTENKIFSTEDYPGAFLAEITTAADDVIKVCEIKLILNPNLQRDLSIVSAQLKYINDSNSGKVPKIEDYKAKIFASCLLQMTEETQKKFNDDVFKITSPYGSEVHNFMNDSLDTSTTNASTISRSFRSAGGKGLAGFIESMNFDWLNQTTWDISKDRKAPKMCKVTMQFSPIHDISPGLDSNGYNRAPIYPIGPYKSRVG
jgi:hypothetical protein